MAVGPAMSGAVRYAADLAKKNSEALSFIPTPRLEQYHRDGQLLLATENDEPCGFVVFGCGWPLLKVFQACIQYDARRRHAGLELVSRLRGIAEGNRQDIALWCADDLDANDFWRAAGFALVGRKSGGVRRGRMLNGWVLPVAGGSLFPFAAAFAPELVPPPTAIEGDTVE